MHYHYHQQPIQRRKHYSLLSVSKNCFQSSSSSSLRYITRITTAILMIGMMTMISLPQRHVKAWFVQQRLLLQRPRRYHHRQKTLQCGGNHHQQQQQPPLGGAVMHTQRSSSYLSSFSTTLLLTTSTTRRTQILFMTTVSKAADTDNATMVVTDAVSSLPTDRTDTPMDDTSTANDAPASNSRIHSIVGIEYIQNCVVDVLNELYDPQQIARGRIMAKLLSINQQKNNKSKKKKKKNTANVTETNDDDDDTDEIVGKELTIDEMTALVDAEMQLQQQQQQRNNHWYFTKYDAAVTTATRSEFGDYQCNAAMTLATSLSALQQQEQEQSSEPMPKITPRSIAETIVTALLPKLQHMVDEPMEIAGPGFINIKFSKQYLSQALYTMVSDPTNRLGIPSTQQYPLKEEVMDTTTTTTTTTTKHRQRIVVDFSSPNIAKEMHVGHLRSTIIGDTLCNVLEFIGHDVIRLNHIGDWGTQFGMLVEHLRDEYPAALDAGNVDTIDLGDLVVLYKAAKQRFDTDDTFKQRARDGVVKLQAGDVESLAAWKSLCSTSRIEYQKIYDVLNIKGLNERGESFYNPYLSDVIHDLQDQGLAVESDGALAVFLDGYSNRDGTPLPMLVRKSDGGYNYATTDLAAIRHRTSMDMGERADRVLYVTDAGQAQHFDMVFEAAKKAKFVPETSTLEHVPFGLVQGEDGKKFATRSGDTVKLKDLLNEAIHIAGKDLRERTYNDTSSEEFLNRVDRVARIVGIGAVKYADLSMNRESNYRFSYERMLSLNGNTAPYMLYAYARICSIVRKASGQPDDGSEIVWPEVASEIMITHESEYDLMRNLVKLSDVIYEVERELYPNRVCDYLFETSQKFNKFYENCSVNNAETVELKASRLSLCTATARTIRLLLTLLGIEVVDKL